MRAALFVEAGTPLSIENVTPVDPGPRDVVVRITASGVCHSDLSLTNGTFGAVGVQILGHEGTGVVEAVGQAVSRVAVGDRVIGSIFPACGDCFYCLHDESHLCASWLEASAVARAVREDGSAVPAYMGLGTFAEAMTVSESSVVRVETDLPDPELALIGCGVTTGVCAALNTAAVRPGSIVVVVGCGGVGQSVVQGARIAGAAQIIAVDPVPLKRDSALALGATDTIDPTAEDPVKAVKAMTGRRGADYAFEVIGRAETIRQVVAMVRPGGTAVVVGMPAFDSDVPIPPNAFLRGKRILGCTYGSAQVRRDIPRMLDLVERSRLDLGSMVSRTIGLQDVDAAFEAMRRGEVIRSVIVP
jgi:S-(hydroxymethyl)glutathione dehydrogenase/alcohol dehydrogenase